MLSYPIGITKFAHLEFQFYKWDMPTITRDTDAVFKKVEPLENVKLYIPEGITDSVSINWGVDDMIQGGDDLLADAARILGSGIKGIAKGLGGAGMINRAEAKVGKQLIPNQALVMQAPGYFDIALNFEMVPEDSDEAGNIKKIIKIFRNNSVPKLSAGGQYMEYPPSCTIKMKLGRGTAGENDVAPVSNKETIENFKVWNDLVISNFNVSYHGDSHSVLYFHDAQPFMSKLSVSFKSLLPMFRD